MLTCSTAGSLDKVPRDGPGIFPKMADRRAAGALECLSSRSDKYCTLHGLHNWNSTKTLSLLTQPHKYRN